MWSKQVICASCNVDNPDGNVFCTSCGTSFGLQCRSCGQRNQVGAKFCGRCGTSIVSGAPTSSTAVPTGLPLSLSREGERKLLTVLFADVAGSTELIASLDPEEAEQKLMPVIEAMRQAVRRFEGSTVRMQGDGVMALFGAPVPQEDHALRACCAALAMQAAIRDLPDGPAAVRVGIHTGDVLARAIETDVSVEYDVTGVAVHVAARLEKIAQDGGVLISEATWTAARPFLDAQSLGAQPLRGVSERIGVYRLDGLRRGPATGRFRSERTLSSMVGRAAEIAMLARAFDRTTTGDARVVGLVGEAGVGKSRLCFEFSETCRSRSAQVVHGRAFAHTRATPFEPVIDLLSDCCGVSPVDTPEQIREKAGTLALALDPGMRADLPLLWDFLGVPDSTNPAPRLDPGVRRDKLLALVQRLIRGFAAERPLVIVLEDLHWLDPGSELFLEALIDAIGGTKVLVLLNFRPGYTASWMGRSCYEQLAIGPLPQDVAQVLANALLGTDDTVAALSSRLQDRARGNPFYIEELVRTLADHGYLAGEHGDYRLLREPVDHLLPSTVQAVIGARIDLRPDIERQILQTASVIGREFRPDIVRKVSAIEDATVRAALHRLVASEIVYELTAAGATTFTFKNPMTQEVVYRSLPADRRRSLHGRVAEALTNELPDPQGADAGLIAYHLEEAGNLQMAAARNLNAAMWHGTRDSAQALDAWKRVRRLIRAQPIEGPGQKLPLMMACGQIVNFGWREGIPVVEAETYYDEAMAIAREMGDVRAITLITAAYGRLLAASGSADDYVTKVRGALELVQGDAHQSLKYTLTAVLAQATRLAGFLPQALELADEALANAHLISANDQQTLGFNVPMWLTGMRGQILAMMARWEEARETAAMVLGGKFGEPDPLHRIQAHSVLADIAWGHDDRIAIDAEAKAMVRIAEATGNPYLLVYAQGYVGLAALAGGDLHEARHRLSSAIAYARKRHAGLENEPRLLADYAHVQCLSGTVEDARIAIREAMTIARSRHQRVWQARVALLQQRLGARDPDDFSPNNSATLLGQTNALCFSSIK